jgi:hypothetical protein
VLLNVDIHDSLLPGNGGNGREKLVLFHTVVVVDQFQPEFSVKEQVFDVSWEADVRSLLIHGIQAANQTIVHVGHSICYVNGVRAGLWLQRLAGWN